MLSQAAFLTKSQAPLLNEEVDVDFRSNAWDEATRLALEKIAARGVDCFGERLDYERPVEHDRIIRCLSEHPMRLRQIAVRCQAKRDNVEAACDALIRWGRIIRDEEAFYALNPLPIVVVH